MELKMGVADWLAGLTRSQTKRPLLWRDRVLQDPYYRFSSLEELRAAAALGVRLDVNRASIDDWLRLPGLSIHQARTLSALSQAGVEFHCVEDIAAALSLPMQRVQPLAPVLQFCYYGEGVERVQSINPNTASLEQITQIPGLDLALAKAILQDRQQRGPYRNLIDFQQRLQLSGPMISDLMHYLSFR